MGSAEGQNGDSHQRLFLTLAPVPIYTDAMAYTDPKPGPGAASSVAGMGMGCLFFIALLFPLLIVFGMAGAHCAPKPGCANGIGSELLWRTLLALGPAILLGAALRSLFHWLGQRIRMRDAPLEAEARIRVPWFGLAGIPLAIFGGILLVWGDAIFYA
jgi:hypothetical protein